MHCIHSVGSQSSNKFTKVSLVMVRCWNTVFCMSSFSVLNLGYVIEIGMLEVWTQDIFLWSNSFDFKSSNNDFPAKMWMDEIVVRNQLYTWFQSRIPASVDMLIWLCSIFPSQRMDWNKTHEIWNYNCFNFFELLFLVSYVLCFDCNKFLTFHSDFVMDACC